MSSRQRVKIRPGGKYMKAYEYYAEILPDGHLSIPEKLKSLLTGESKIRVMLLLEDEEATWRNFTVAEFIKGYSEKDAMYDSL
jgi:hypothetical protein